MNNKTVMVIILCVELIKKKGSSRLVRSAPGEKGKRVRVLQDPQARPGESTRPTERVDKHDATTTTTVQQQQHATK